MNISRNGDRWRIDCSDEEVAAILKSLDQVFEIEPLKATVDTMTIYEFITHETDASKCPHCEDYLDKCPYCHTTKRQRERLK